MWFLLLMLDAVLANYQHHRLVSITAKTIDDLKFLDALSENPDMQLDFWTGLSVRAPIDVRVAPQDFGRLQSYLAKANLAFTVSQENLQALVDQEKASMSVAATTGLCDPLTTYCTFEEVESLLVSWAGMNPDRMQLSTMNTASYEGRPIHQVKIASDLNSPKDAIWIESCTHAREWITVSSALMLIQTLLGNDTMANSLLANYDWYIAPVHNPDGYVFTHTDDRFWRKNRQPCPGGTGTDLNRNWDADFGGSGSSKRCRSETYRGQSAFSAPETAALRDAVLATNNVKAYFSIHCYSQLLLVPYGYTNTKPGRYLHLVDVAENMTAQMYLVDNRNFTTGTPPDLLYFVSGSSLDYFYIQGFPYSYSYELRPENGAGTSGFVLPISEIGAATNEVIASLWAFVNNPTLNWDTESSHP